MGKVTKVLFYFFTAILGITFLYSAYSKILTIQNFEWTIAETGIFSFGIANIVSRLLLVAEAVIGFLLLLNVSFNKKVYVIAAILLAVFSIYLFWVLKVYGNNGNCGCFGDEIKMSPLNGIIKNVIMLLLLGFLYKFETTWHNYYKIIALLAGIGLPLWLAPPDFIFVKHKDTFNNKAIDLNGLFAKEAYPKADSSLLKGKHIITFLSTSCHHCKSAARKLATMYNRKPNLPLYNVFKGDSTSLESFFVETFSKKIPYQRNDNFFFIENAISFDSTRAGFPKIMWINNGVVERISNSYFTLEENDIIDWVNKK